MEFQVNLLYNTTHLAGPRSRHLFPMSPRTACTVAAGTIPYTPTAALVVLTWCVVQTDITASTKSRQHLKHTLVFLMYCTVPYFTVLYCVSCAVHELLTSPMKTRNPRIQLPFVHTCPANIRLDRSPPPCCEFSPSALLARVCTSPSRRV